MRQEAMPQIARSAVGRGRWLERAVRLLERMLRLGSRPTRRLRLCESVSLGERRFVAVVEFEKRRFLLGGAGQSLVLLAKLDEPAEPSSERAAEGLD